jgi:hypothetical protein
MQENAGFSLPLSEKSVKNFHSFSTLLPLAAQCNFICEPVH